jgi:hypothetical protein
MGIGIIIIEVMVIVIIVPQADRTLDRVLMGRAGVQIIEVDWRATKRRLEFLIGKSVY